MWGHLTELRRTRSGTVDVAECVDLDGADLEHVSAPECSRGTCRPWICDQVVRVGTARVVSTCRNINGRAHRPGEDLVAVVDGTSIWSLLDHRGFQLSRFGWFRRHRGLAWQTPSKGRPTKPTRNTMPRPRRRA